MAKVIARRKSAPMTLPLAALAGFAPLVSRTVTGFQSGGLPTATHEVVAGLTGYQMDDGQWNVNNMRYGTFPILLGLLVHKLATRLGVNRALGRARVPFLRV